MSCIYGKILAFHAKERDFKVVLVSHDKLNLIFMLLYYLIY